MAHVKDGGIGLAHSIQAYAEYALSTTSVQAAMRVTVRSPQAAGSTALTIA